jgi:thiol:disulfide interchange protein DsbD
MNRRIVPMAAAVLLVFGWSPLLGDEGSSPNAFVPVYRVSDLDDALTRASGQFVLLRVHASWSLSSEELNKTFESPGVQEALTGVVLLSVDVTHNTEEDKALLSRYDIFGAPWVLLFDKEGQRIPDADIAGYQTEETVVAHLKRAFGPAQ